MYSTTHPPYHSRDLIPMRSRLHENSDMSPSHHRSLSPHLHRLVTTFVLLQITLTMQQMLTMFTLNYLRILINILPSVLLIPHPRTVNAVIMTPQTSTPLTKRRKSFSLVTTRMTMSRKHLLMNLPKHQSSCATVTKNPFYPLTRNWNLP